MIRQETNDAQHFRQNGGEGALYGQQVLPLRRGLRGLRAQIDISVLRIRSSCESL